MIKRREFLKAAAALAGAFSIGQFPEKIQAEINQVSKSTIPTILYLQGQSCTGCSISLLQSANPKPETLITQFSKLAFHADLSSTSGHQALGLIRKYISGNAGEYYLAIEGSIPNDMPEACIIGEKPLSEWLIEASKTMSGAFAVGTCATFGGIPAAEGNPTGAICLKRFFQLNNIQTLLIQLPGCPVHPDWLWHTVTQLVKFGMPKLTPDTKLPEQFYGKRVHEQCPRYHDFQEEIFAKNIGDTGCLFQLGCNGPITFADCPNRWWNNGTTWCVDTNAPCVGCASEEFAKRKKNPFYRLNEANIAKGVYDER